MSHGLNPDTFIPVALIRSFEPNAEKSFDSQLTIKGNIAIPDSIEL